MCYALKNNQITRIKFTLSRAKVLIFTRKIREKMCKNYFRKTWKIKQRLFSDTMCWRIAFVHIKKYRHLSIPDLINVLKTLQDKLSALVYCQRDRTPNTFDSLERLQKSNCIQVFSIVQELISVRRQNNPDLLKQLKSLQQSLEIDLKNIDFIPQKESDLSSITAKSRSKRPSKRAVNPQNKTTTTSSPS